MQSDDLDKLLQEGLESYCDAEPLAGLEERVLRHVRDRRTVLRWTWFGWAAATACTCLVLMVVFELARDGYRQAGSLRSTIATAPLSSEPRVDRGTAAEKATPHLSNEVAANVPERQVVHAHSARAMVSLARKAKPEELPKLEVFPTPHPLSPEERALVEFVNQHPKEAAQLVDAERRSSEPIQIAAIHIEPLNTDGPQQEEEKNANDH